MSFWNHICLFIGLVCLVVSIDSVFFHSELLRISEWIPDVLDFESLGIIEFHEYLSMMKWNEWPVLLRNGSRLIYREENKGVSRGSIIVDGPRRWYLSYLFLFSYCQILFILFQSTPITHLLNTIPNPPETIHFNNQYFLPRRCPAAQNDPLINS